MANLPHSGGPNVVHLTSAHPAFDIRIFHKECKTLARAGYFVSLIAPHYADEVVDGVTIKCVPRGQGRFRRWTTSQWYIYRKVRHDNNCIFHFHDPDLILIGFLLWARGKTVIYDVHEDVPRDVACKEYIPSWLRPILCEAAKIIEAAAASRFAGIVCATESIARRFQAVNNHTVVARNFPSVAELTADAAWCNRQETVVYTGLIAARRGIREMVEAMELLPGNLRATLELAGSFEMDRDYKQVTRLPGWKRTNWLGTLTRTEIASLLQHAKVGLVVYHPIANHLEAGPHKLFEYMAAGIPVVASDFPLWRTIVEQAGCGLVVDPLKPQSIASAVEYLLRRPFEAEEMGKRGRNAVEQQFNWEAEGNTLLRLYRSLLNAAHERKSPSRNRA
jgi:glycosyltransferase involved in cell wall biosynthesis